MLNDMSVKTSALFGWFFVSLLVVQAETERTISLNECIQRALRYNLDLRIAKAEPEIAKAKLRGASAAYYDPNLSVRGGRSSDTQPGGVDEHNRAFAGSEQETDSFSSSILGRTPTGASIGLRSFLNDSEGTNSSGAFTHANGAVFAEIRQPLLKDLLIDDGRLIIRISHQELHVSRLELQGEIMRLVSQVESAYIDLIAARANLTVRREAEALAAKILDGDLKRIAATTLAPNDAKQSEAQLEARRVGVLQARQTVYLLENSLKSLFTADFAIWRDIRLLPDPSFVSGKSATLEINVSWERALLSRPDLRQAQLDLETQGLILRHAKQARLPSLDVVGRYGLAGSGRDRNAVRRGIEQHTGPSWSLGVEISFPLTNGRAHNDYRTAQLRLGQHLAALRQLEQNILIEIDDAHRAAELAQERVAAAQRAEQLASEAVEAEEKKLSTGRSTTFVVLLLQNNLTEARLQKVLADAQYERALVQLALSEGSTLERHKIDVE